MPAESFPDSRIDSMLGELKPVFLKEYGVKDEKDVEWLLFTFAPGRINFIGEHVDYLGGWVCPAAVTEGTHILVGRVKRFADPSQQAKLRFFATYNKQHYEMESTKPGNDHSKDWKTYVRGAVTLRLEELGMGVDNEALRGVCFVVHSTLAMGAGMSASAAFSVGLILALDSVATGAYKKAPRTVDRSYRILPRMADKKLVELAKQARRIEIEFCGVNVGIMDQFASALSDYHKFMFLDCLNYHHETFSLEPLLGSTYGIVLIDSMLKHELAGGSASVYNQVRTDQEEAERKITKHIFNDKKTFTFSAFVRDTASFNTDARRYSEDNRVAIMEEVKPHLTTGEYERGCYQLTEQERTLAFKRLNDGSMPSLDQAERVRRVGELLNETHMGLSRMLKVSTEQLDFIQEIIASDPDAAGGRVMGAGFGGCVLALVKKCSQERILHDVCDKFKAKYGVENTVYIIDELGCGAFSAALTSKPPHPSSM